MRKLLASLALVIAAEPCAGARLFSSASSQCLDGAAPVTGMPSTHAAWFVVDDITNDYNIIETRRTSNDGNYYQMIFRGAVNDKLGCIFGGGGGWAETSVTVTEDAPHLGVCTYTSTTLHTAYIDGGNAGTNTSLLVAPSSISETHIGCGKGAARGRYLSGRVWEAAMWDAVLTSSEVAALYTGISPTLIRPGNLVAYWPLIGRSSPEPDIVNRNELTLYNAPTYTEHYRMSYAGRRTGRWASIAVGQPIMRRWESVPFMPSGRGRGGIRMLTDTVPSLEEIPCVGCSR